MAAASSNRQTRPALKVCRSSASPGSWIIQFPSKCNTSWPCSRHTSVRATVWSYRYIHFALHLPVFSCISISCLLPHLHLLCRPRQEACAAAERSERDFGGGAFTAGEGTVVVVHADFSFSLFSSFIPSHRDSCCVCRRLETERSGGGQRAAAHGLRMGRGKVKQDKHRCRMLLVRDVCMERVRSGVRGHPRGRGGGTLHL